MKESWKKGILPGPMLKCLSWINDISKDPKCLGILCAHERTLEND